jgi:hypothetical protein
MRPSYATRLNILVLKESDILRLFQIGILHVSILHAKQKQKVHAIIVVMWVTSRTSVMLTNADTVTSKLPRVGNGRISRLWNAM